MGHRANYVLRSRSEWTLHYSHWGGESVDLDFADGPVHAVRFVQAQERVGGWLGAAGVEGGALIDEVRQRLLFFGGDCSWDLAYRRAYLDHLARTWPAWTVKWAFNELRDVASAVGAEEALDLPEPQTEAEPPLLAAEGSQGCWALLTVREPDGRASAGCLDPFAGRHWAVWEGPDVLARLPDGVLAPEPAGTTPDWGLHVDAAQRRIGWWTAGSDRLPHRVASRWPGWHVEFWEDHYEEQLAACDGQVRAPSVDVDDGRRRLQDRLSAPRTDPVSFVLELVERRRSERHHVEILAPITSHTAVDPDTAGAP